MKPRVLLILAVTSAAVSESEADTTAAVEPPWPTTEPVIVEPRPITPAPRPDQASGVAEEDEVPASHGWLWLPRSILFVPRMAFWVAVQPARGVAYATEHYDLLARVEDAAFTDDRRFGAYPVAGYESTYGFSIGARVVGQDLFGEGERIKLRANWGGEFRYAVGGKISTGTRFGRVELSNDTSYERRGRERFYGIGDGPELDAPPAMPIDPSIDNSSIRGRFSEDLFRNKLVIKTKIVGGLSSRLTGAFVDREFGAADTESIEMSYETDKLAGFENGVRNVYAEHELAYDSRRPGSPYATQTLDGTGWFIAAHAGVARGIDKDPTRYVRYGGEIQRYFNLYEGTRILMVRALVDAVGGTDGRTDGRIAFVELPQLGGSEYLRGYSTGRFRDRSVALATAEYSWQLSNHFTAYSFFDIGGPMATVEDIAPSKLRFGYGGGLQLHSKNTFYARTQFAASREGDFFFQLIFSPAYGRRERAGRF